MLLRMHQKMEEAAQQAYESSLQGRLQAITVAVTHGSFNMANKTGSTASTLCQQFGVNHSPDIQLVADYIELGGNYQDRVWSFQISKSEGSLMRLDINYQASSGNLSWTGKTASISIPTLYETRTRAVQRWDGDLGRIFGVKRTKYLTEQHPRALNQGELELIHNHLRQAVTN